ncbi:hypothetical protein SAMD00019534_042190 [Acytostelium subglobosum LB1]|uniref:hypothetical protein n=1 Tax=Acytostelium subglobosum LB1 TaxID=1410327 RepID=UPI000644E995|nr:hypothetical protein SAMD00019534_042190 [Acytostelium subglobosum LB1]GAM21044.1 hypothetical protein SAMD00019534_042190 [Acytostelium subglobosum LB1]|eukprot:XP_012756178.1 hypothetical protein SAMD00019534_042190 [Acytostelium subglobosum LB1]
MMTTNNKLFILLVTILVSIMATTAEVTPVYVNIGFTAQQDEMRVSWYTVNNSTAGVVRYSNQSMELDLAAGATASASSSSTEYGEFPGWFGFVNTAVMSGLAPLTQYFYQVGDASADVWSPVFNFTTGAGATVFKPFAFSVYGDMGGGNYMLNVDSLITNSDRFDWILHVGDIAYADYSNSSSNKGIRSGMLGNMTVWNDFMTSITPFSAHQSYMTCIGNHDAFLNKSAYTTTWIMPSESPLITWYAFDYNGVHFVSMSTENDYAPGSEQYVWLENHLQQFRASNPNTWLIVYGHRPFYCTTVINWCMGTNNLALYEAMDPLMMKYNVDIFIAGHTHAYERSFPVYDKVVAGTFAEPKATVYISVGVGGNWEGLDPLFNVDKPHWADYRKTELGYGILNVVNETTIHWQFIQQSDDTAVMDQFTLIKGTF